MDLNELKALYKAQKEQDKEVIIPADSSQAMQKILKAFLLEMKILMVLLGTSILSVFVGNSKERIYFSIFLAGLALALILFILYFYRQIKSNTDLNKSIKAVLTSQIRSIKNYINLYYTSTFIIIPISLAVSVLIANKFSLNPANLLYQWPLLCLVGLVVLFLTGWVVKKWIKHFYLPHLRDLEASLRDLEN